MGAYSNTILLTGIPRSGTTLCCYLLNQYHNTVALHEPIDPDLVSVSATRAQQVIRDFTLETRQRALASKALLSKQLEGAVPDNPVSLRSDGSREESVTLGEIMLDKPVTEDFTLVVKHNALFAALSDGLKQDFEFYALVRNPLPVLASWCSVSLPVGDGRLPMGERFNTDLKEALLNEPDLLERQLIILSWFYERFRDVEPECVLTYEEIVQTNGGSLSRVTKQQRLESTPVTAQFKNSLLSPDELDRLASILIEREELYNGFYCTEDIRLALNEMLS